LEQVRVYKEDQLLAHPGGDLVDLEAPDPLNSLVPQDGFLQRIAKDISDAASNLVNFFKDLLGGSTYRYVDRAGKVQSARRRGLGATIAYSMVKSHEGHILAETPSSSGSGSRFTIFLPALEEHDESRAPSPSCRDEAPRGQGERILLVDDEP